MITSKKLDSIIPCILIAAIICSLLLIPSLNISSSIRAAQPYEKAIFDADKDLDIHINMSEEYWTDLLNNPGKKTYYSCDVAINGTIYKNVGIRTKGSSSLTDVKNTFKSDRYSLQLKFDKYTEGQNCKGLTKLILNNCIYDATYMRDAIAYDMARSIGLAAPLTNFANVHLNDRFLGCYMAVEPVAKSFLTRNYDTTSATVYEPFGSPEYIDDDISSYKDLYQDVKVGKSNEETKTIIRNAVKSVYTGEHIEDYIDIDNVMKYMALQTIAVNHDSVLGASGHNYYMYVKGGKIGFIPWDYNLAFGGYTAVSDFADVEAYAELNEILASYQDLYETMSEDEVDEIINQVYTDYMNNLSDEKKADIEAANAELAFDNTKEVSQYVNFPIDTPFSCDLANRTFFMKLLENESYKGLYYKYLNQLCSKYIQSGKLDVTMARIDRKIGNIAGTEANAFYTNEQYQKATQVFKELLQLKSQSVLAQINGTIPKTWDTQEAAADKLIDASHIHLTDMGGSFE